jgi:hypothetical protein
LDFAGSSAYDYGKGIPKGVDATDAKAIVGGIAAKFSNAPKTTVVQHVADLPAEVQSEIRAELSHGKLRSAWYDANKHEAWLIADHMYDLTHARRAAEEEMFGHGAMEQFLRSEDIAGLYKSIKAFKPQEFVEITRDYGLDHSKTADRETLVREFVAKQTDALSTQEPVWKQLRNVVILALARANVLPSMLRGRAFDAQIQGLARKAIDQGGAIPPEGPAASESRSRLTEPQSGHRAVSRGTQVAKSRSQSEVTPGAPTSQDMLLSQCGFKLQTLPEFDPALTVDLII